MLTRRMFLTSTTLASASLGVGASSAAAFSLEPAETSVAKSYRAGLTCGKLGSYHAQLIADAETILTGKQLTAEQRQMVLAGFTCPICGCALNAV